MVNSNDNNRENKSEEIRDQKVAEEVHRLTISRVAEEALVSILKRVNDGFSVGKVNRNNVANWVLTRFNDSISQDDIKEIRSAHTDEFAALDVVLRRAKENGELPPELRAYLKQQKGIEQAPKKKVKRILQTDVINDDI